MAAGSGSGDSALDELIEMVRCRTGGAQDDLVGVWYGCPGRWTQALERDLLWVVGCGGVSTRSGRLGVYDT